MEREGARVKSILLGYGSAAIAKAEPVYGGGREYPCEYLGEYENDMKSEGKRGKNKEYLE